MDDFRLEPSPPTDMPEPCSVCGGAYINHDGCQLYLLSIQREREDLGQLRLFEEEV